MGVFYLLYTFAFFFFCYVYMYIHSLEPVSSNIKSSILCRAPLHSRKGFNSPPPPRAPSPEFVAY